MFRKCLSMTAVLLIVLGFTSAAVAADGEGGESSGTSISYSGLGKLSAPIGAAIALVGGSMGIARIGSVACESVARQPEAGGKIFTSMIITAAMIEGTTLFAVVVCLLAIY